MSTEQPQQQQQQQSDVKKVGSDCEDFSDTANETGTFEVSTKILQKRREIRKKKKKRCGLFYSRACGMVLTIEHNVVAILGLACD